jgi:[ribosomal protein S18]-alanine N-acetyltransferase
LGRKYRNRFLGLFGVCTNPFGISAKSGPTRLHGYNEAVEFTLRDFRQPDFETLWRIDQQCFAPGISYSRVELAAYLQRPRAFAVVAESARNGKPVAPAKGLLEESPAATPELIVGFIVAEKGSRMGGHIITIDVLPQARKIGVGSRLLRVAEERLRAAQCHFVILETAVDNRVALAFYKTHEYHVLKTIPRYYSDGVDALVMKKDLLSPPGPAKLPQ